MYLGKVIGTAIATRKDEKLIGSKFMITQPLNIELEPVGEAIIAVDTVGSGIGELVMFSKGTAARNAARKSDSPIDAAIIGIIDNMSIDD